jgi:RNA polymerase sigma-70 factor (ECF subfamily)
MREPGPTLSDATGGRGPIDWPAVLAAHGRWLRLVVLARLGERQAVEEVLQELALAAVAARRMPDDPARLPAWLYRLAVRQTLLYRRRHARQRRLVGRYADRLDATGFETAPDPLGWLIRDERARLVREALRRLPPGDAEILLLKYAEGCTAPELAARLGVSVAAVEARLHRGRCRLRAALAGSDVIEAHERLQ